MGKILSLMAVVSMTLTINAASIYDDVNYIERWGQLKLVGNQLSSAKGDAIQLKGWSTQSIYSPDNQNCLGKDQFELMKHYGANIVRLSMPIDDESNGGSYMANKEASKERMKGYIDDAYNAGMYVMVDWHTLETNGKEGNPWNQREDARNFFSEISSYAKSKKYNHVLYELCNEPVVSDSNGWDTIKKYAELVIPVIIENQPEAMIIVGTNQWCQKILEPVINPIDSVYKKNVLYSFHYSACSHFAFLGDFRKAQSLIPVFVSEWSAVKFNGDGPFCKSNADKMVSDCDYKAEAPQVVSWCIWNWGKKDDATSFFTGACGEENLSQQLSDDGQRKYGEYVVDIMGGRQVPPLPPCCVNFEEPNVIPTTSANAWHWDAYAYGGEGVAFHDANSSAWIKDSTGVVVDYSNDGEEVDVYSMAKQFEWINKSCPWSTVEDGRVVAFDSTISTMWKDGNGKATYKSLNAGRTYSGTDGSRRPDEGVDLNYANCKGTEYENMGYNSLYRVENGEWIDYVVKVEKPGYYKIKGIISSEYKAASKNGEISIVSQHGNLLRSISSQKEADAVTTFGFPKTAVCADSMATDSTYWNCWKESDAISGDNKEVLCVFEKAGEQDIKIVFNGDASGVGPLIFEWYGDFDPEDPFVCGDCGGSDPSAVDDVDATKFSINPNPTSGEFTVTLGENIEASVEVVNMAGQVVASQKVVGSATINKSLTAGVYTVVVKTNAGVSTQKLVVK